LDPEDFEHLQPIITPITTTDEVLGPDKKKNAATEVNKQASAASIKSTTVLSKYWGDEFDTDDNVDPEIDTDPQQASHIDTSKYLATPSDTIKKGKRGRPKKQRSPNKVADTTSQIPSNLTSKSQDATNVHTRSQSGSLSQRHTTSNL
jgi:hypothetical protein